MLPLAAGLLIFRGVYLNSEPASVLPADAAAALFDTFVRFIKEGRKPIAPDRLARLFRRLIAGAGLGSPAMIVG